MIGTIVMAGDAGLGWMTPWVFVLFGGTHDHYRPLVTEITEWLASNVEAHCFSVWDTYPNTLFRVRKETDAALFRMRWT